ncbi:hypothetical protein [Chitinimonas arctica]|nr:hypothetical protein [Chitinimonas arctica]
MAGFFIAVGVGLRFVFAFFVLQKGIFADCLLQLLGKVHRRHLQQLDRLL